jgi:hypothetical protein
MTATKKTADATRKPRKPYTPPRLVSYGHVKDIVQGNDGGMSDTPGTTRMCRVAEVLYGAADARTLLLRGWFTAVHAERRPGWLLVEMYRRAGPRAAALLEAGRLPRALFLPLFNRLADKAFSVWARRIQHERHRRAV